MQSFNILANTEELKYDLVREVTSLKGRQFNSIYYLSACEIWPDKRDGLW